jgi:hypothetical protein
MQGGKRAGQRPFMVAAAGACDQVTLDLSAVGPG